MTQDEIAQLIESALVGGFGGKHRKDEIDFRCVAHEEQNASASWNRKRGAWNCLACGAGGSWRDLAERLGIKIEKPRESGQIVATYDYRDEQGSLLYQAVRYQPKTFKQRRPDGAGGWIWNLKGARLVLYRLPELLASTGRVFVVEGEKDVEAIRSRGGTATCNAMGANETGKSKWYPESYNAALAGREVCIIPDRDKAGDNHGAFVAQSLAGTAAVVKLLTLPGLEYRAKGGLDVSDWFAAGGTFDELTDLADACEPWKVAEATAHEFPETDSGNAEMFAHMYGERVRYDWKRERWLVWDRHRWIPDATGELIRLSIKVARERARQAADLSGDRAQRAFGFAKSSEGAGKIEAMQKLARALPPIADAGEGWDANPLLMCFENGVVNLATGEMRAGVPEDRITRTTGIPYAPGAPCCRWERFMAEVLPDPQVREFVRLAMGYSITGITREQVFFILHGRGENGKGTLLDTLRDTVGQYGDIMAFATIEKGKESSIPSDMAALAGKRVITTSETDKATRFNEARIKSLTGQDPIKGRELYHTEFTYQPELKLWIAVNDKPTVHDDSHGMWRRVRLIPFVATFSAAERDNSLRDTLKAEAQGIAAWLVRAAMDWHRTSLPIPPAVAVATTEYRAESDPLAMFITDRCMVMDHAQVGAATLYKAYKAWAEGQAFNQRETLSATMFGRLMGDRFRKRAFKGSREYLGIGLISDGWGAKPSTQVEGFTSREGLLRTSAGIPTREYGELPENPLEPSKPSTQENSCPCDDCPAEIDAAVGCDGQPFWLDETGAHCRRCCDRVPSDIAMEDKQ